MQIQVDSQTGWVSDVHLSHSEPDLSARFLAALAPLRDNLSRLIILGDLFESWIGDDLLIANGLTGDLSKVQVHAQQICTALANLGCEILIVHGNRDFLIGPGLISYLNQRGASAQILPELTFAEAAGKKILLAHGDQWCIEDHAYQTFRQQVRSDSWQQQFLNQSLEERAAIANSLRSRSELAKQDKPESIMDVHLPTIEKVFAIHLVQTVIHGHTHRPAVHDLGLGRQRIVLSDWDPAGTRGEIKIGLGV